MKSKLGLNRESILESFNQDKQALIPIGVLLAAGVLFIVFILQIFSRSLPRSMPGMKKSQN